MNKYLIILALSTLFIGCSNSEEVEKQDGSPGKESSELLAIKMEKPEGWYDATDSDLREKLEKSDLDEQRVEELMKSKGGILTVALYTKYDLYVFPGFMPSIQVSLRPNRTKNFKDFRSSIEKSMEPLAEVFDNFKIHKELSEVKIGGMKGLFILYSSELPGEGLNSRTQRSRYYAIPMGRFFYQINLSDFKDDDHSALYEGWIKSITFE